MHPIRKQRLMIVSFIVVGASVAVGLMAYALRDNINLFYEPAKVASGEAPVGKRIRVGGMVVEGSWDKGEDGVTHRFVLTDYEARVPVTYTGILPDLFSEGEGAVATGILTAKGMFEAEQVLAKHDENYMPPELAKALDGKHPGANPDYSLDAGDDRPETDYAAGSDSQPERAEEPVRANAY